LAYGQWREAGRGHVREKTVEVLAHDFASQALDRRGPLEEGVQ
jgi:hypothetical protein